MLEIIYDFEGSTRSNPTKETKLSLRRMCVTTNIGLALGTQIGNKMKLPSFRDAIRKHDEICLALGTKYEYISLALGTQLGNTMRKQPSVRDAIRKQNDICLALGTQLGDTTRSAWR